MTITHISEREAALTRENARLLKTINIQSVTIEAQQEELAKLRAELAALKSQPMQPAPLTDESTQTVDRAWAQFCAVIGDSKDAPYPGMIASFENHYGQSFADKDWRNEASIWAQGWQAAVRTGGAG